MMSCAGHVDGMKKRIRELPIYFFVLSTCPAHDMTSKILLILAGFLATF